MMLKNIIKEENGSMAVYVSVVLLTMLILIMAIFLTSGVARKIQTQTSIGVKTTYESDNSKADKIYEELTQKLNEKYIYVEDFNTQPNYPSSNTDITVNDGIVTLTATGNDPQIMMYNVTSFNPLEYRYIDVKYKVINGTDVMEFFMIENPSDQTYSVSHSLENDGQWHVLTIDLWDYPNVKSRETITGWRWDWVGASTSSIQVDYIKIRK